MCSPNANPWFSQALQHFLFIKSFSNNFFCLTFSWRGLLSYRNQSIDLQSKSMDWFLYDNGLRYERVKNSWVFHLSFQLIFQVVLLVESNFINRRLYLYCTFICIKTYISEITFNFVIQNAAYQIFNRLIFSSLLRKNMFGSHFGSKFYPEQLVKLCLHENFTSRLAGISAYPVLSEWSNFYHIESK